MNYGVFTENNREIAVTGRFAYELYARDNRNFGVRLYRDGRAIALCKYNGNVTRYAFENSAGAIVGNCHKLKRIVESRAEFDVPLDRLTQVEEIKIVRQDMPLPTANENNVRECLSLWRQGCNLIVQENSLLFTCVTGKIEYVCQMGTEGDNIYCGASITIPANGGMVGGNQYFRIRNYGDNSEPWCHKFCNLGWEKNFDVEVDESLFKYGVCNIAGNGLLYWSVKTLEPDRIVLEGCDGDEYVYLRDGSVIERFTLKN